MPLDVDRLAEAMLAGTQALIAKALAPLVAANDNLTTRNAELEARLLAVEAREMPPSIDPDAILGLQDGLAAAVAAIEAREEPDIAAAVQEAVSAAVAGMEPPAVPDVAPIVAEAVRAAVEALPVANDGKDADPAEIEALREELAAVKASIPAPVTLPEPPDLTVYALKSDIPEIPPAPDMTPFATEVGLAALRERVDAIKMPEVIHGKDGVGFTEARLNDDGELILKLANGETFNVGKVRGDDGLGFEHMSTEWDGERTLTMSFTRDSRTEVTSMTIPAMIYRGVWRDGAYKAGDAVTWGGSLFIARRDTSDKPETSDAWTLAAKRGRDGKDAKDVRQG